MPTYFVTGRDSRDREVVREVDASSGDEAVAKVAREGLRDVRLESSETGAAIRAQFDAGELAIQRRTVSRRARLEIERKGPGAAVSALRRSLVPWALLGPVVSAGLVWLGHPASWRLGPSDWSTIAAGFIPLTLLLVAPRLVRSATAPYDRLLTALVWHRWSDLLSIVDELDRHGVGPARVRLPAIELAGRRAQALAGLGRIEEAEATLQPFLGDPKVPEWMYWHRMSSLHAAADDDERQLAYMERALAYNPTSIEYVISLAQTLVVIEHGDPTRAKALVDEVRSRAPRRARHAISMVDGLVALADGRDEDALAHLDRARAELASDLPRNALIDASSVVLYGRSALALARLGRREEALERLAVARPLLEAQGLTRLVARIDAATNA